MLIDQIKGITNPLAVRLLALGLALLALVGCQSQVSTTNSGTGSALAVNTTQVIILYNDSTPSTLSVQGNHGLIRPGTAEQWQGALKTGVSSQAYSYTEAAQIYATMLANLIGRYSNLKTVIRPVSTYVAGDALQNLRTFYIGSTYEDPVPNALITDVMAGAPVTWMNYQVWRLDNAALNASLSKLGLQYISNRAAYLPADYTTSFNKIDYRGFTYDKYLAPMEIMEVQPIAGANVTVHAWAKDSTGKQIPYALQSGNFWYVADIPFSYIHETDRYLVMADLLGPMLGHNETCTPRAISRMEDVSPNDDATDLKRMLDVYQKVNIPFGVTVIPQHKDITSNTTVNWTQNLAALTQVWRIPTIKGRVFQHGYTHQYSTLLNPYGTSGDDFEFWRVTLNADGSWNYVGPIPGMTPDIALARVVAGRTILLSLAISPVGWVTPHYAADPSYYAKFNTVYSRVWERRLYRVGNTVAGQFFPYPVRDISGSLVLPEDMGSVQPNYGLDKVMLAAQANRGLRCPWAGHFNHPYTLNPAYTGPGSVGAAAFEKLLRDVQALGYTYVDPSTVATQ